ncbi:MAG: enoyl-CoA hydratase/isomerase family protein, partial [Xanthomonadales bacterium]|nr:enoyl-CoA hydratase/isomerase family protein [Xanthomonadales bacterium]
MSENQEVLYEVKDKVATITMNRPKRRNALNADVMAGLNQYFDQAGADPEVSAIILTGAGGNFCSGADLGGSFNADQSFLGMHYDRSHYADLLVKMNTCKKPILAAIEGYCLAGGMG